MKARHEKVLASLSALLAIYIACAALGLFEIGVELYPGYPNLLGVLLAHRAGGFSEYALTFIFASYATVAGMLSLGLRHAHKLAFPGFLFVLPFWPVGTLMSAYYFWYWIYQSGDASEDA